MNNYVDEIYGSFKLDEKITKLLQVPEMKRLKHINLVSVPERLLNIFGLYFNSRLQHSVGVRYLSKFLNKGETREIISICGLLHDIGSPPFSHATEKIMVNHIGKDHESMNIDIIKNSEIKIHYILFSELKDNCDAICKFGEDKEILKKISRVAN